jgi:integrase
MGSIYRRGKVYWIKFYAGGKRVYKSANTDSKRAAKLFLAKEEAKSGKHSRFRFAELIHEYLRDIERRDQKSRYETDGRARKHILPLLGDFRTEDVNAYTIADYIDRRREVGAANATINRELAIITRAFTLAREQGRIVSQPKIQKLPEARPRQGFVEWQDLVKISRALGDLWILRFIMLFAFYTGWRKSEITNLRLSDVNFFSGEIFLRDSKFGESRVIFMGRVLRRILERARTTTNGPGPYFFEWQHGGQVKDFRASWDKACELAGLPGILFHDLPRSAVRRFMLLGIPVHTAMKITGHRTRHIFDRYRIVSDNELKDAAKNL